MITDIIVLIVGNDTSFTLTWLMTTGGLGLGDQLEQAVMIATSSPLTRSTTGTGTHGIR